MDVIDRCRSALQAAQGRSVLYYPSSGPGSTGLSDLPYECVVLSDYTFPDVATDGHLIRLPVDNNSAVRLMYEAGVRIDTAVLYNDGCVEGGNYECVGWSNFLSKILLVLKDGGLVDALQTCANRADVALRFFHVDAGDFADLYVLLHRRCSAT